jgi:hypothetical protein
MEASDAAGVGLLGLAFAFFEGGYKTLITTSIQNVQLKKQI